MHGSQDEGVAAPCGCTVRAAAPFAAVRPPFSRPERSGCTAGQYELDLPLRYSYPTVY